MDLYKLLGIDRNASANEIRKAYLKLSKEHHPDKGGDPETFKKIQKAYDVLSDEQSRDFYNMTGTIPGEDGPVEAAGAGGFPFDIGSIFGSMFGGGGMKHAGPVQKQPKGPTKMQEIGLTLRQFYHGHRLAMSFDRQKFCDTCTGTGAARKDVCDGCSGSGIQAQKVMMGPIIMSSTGPCGKCGGKGSIIQEKCRTCDGRALIPDNKQLNIMIDPGMSPGDVLIFENGCSDDPMYEKPGDVRVVLQEADENCGWKRTGDMLEHEIRIGLAESLAGATKKIVGHPRAPDGIYVAVQAGSVTGDVLMLKGEGMPLRGSGGARKGDARVRITVVPSADERRIMEEKGAGLVAGIFEMDAGQAAQAAQAADKVIKGVRVPVV